MGQAGNGAAQAAVFDLGDLTHPVRQTMVRYSAGTVAAAGTDPRQFTWLPDRPDRPHGDHPGVERPDRLRRPC